MAGSKRPKRAKRRKINPSALRLGDESTDGSPPQPSPTSDSPALPANLPDSYSEELMCAVERSVEAGLALTHTLRVLGLAWKFQQWRKADPRYIDGRLAAAESKFIGKNLARIDSAADKYWQAAAWLLERRYPSQFSAGVGRGKASSGLGGPVNVMIINSAIPRPYDILKHRGKLVGEPKTPPDEIDAYNAQVMDVVTNVKRVKELPEGEEEEEE